MSNENEKGAARASGPQIDVSHGNVGLVASSPLPTQEEKRGALQVSAGPLPVVSRPEQIERQVEAAKQIFDGLWEAAIQYGNDWRMPGYRNAAAWLASDAPKELIAAIDRYSKPATVKNIANAIAHLVAAFPNVSRPELKIYSKTLAEDVGAMQPGQLALEWACRHLRRSSKFVPAISEVLDAVRDAGERIRFARYLAAERIPELVREIERERERRLRIEAERAARSPERERIVPQLSPHEWDCGR